MSTEKSVKQIDKYLNDLDKSGDYPASFSEFIKELNTRIFIPIRIQKEDGEISAEDYTLSYLLALPGVGAIGFDYGDNLLDYRQQLLQPASLDEYITALTAYLEAEATPTESTLGMPGVGEQNITYNSMANIELISSISESIFNWNEQDTDVRTYNIDDPKIQGLTPVTSKGETPEGETIFGSNDYYSSPGITLNTANQYVDPVTGQPKRYNDKILSPHFRLGSATEVFSGLSQEAIFEIQQELASLGLDLGSYNFVPGVVDTTLRNEGEIYFIAQLMTRANDLIATKPELNLIDRNAPTLLGQLRPYMEWQKGRNEETNLNIGAYERAGYPRDIVPPTEAEVKSAIDQLFIERNINPTANDYQKYETIFANLKKDAAERALEIQQNELTLGDIIGLSKSYNNTTEIGPYTYGGFGITVPSAEEAREKLGKPLLQQIDVTTELGKIIDDLEAGRIDASQEILARTAAAQDFKRNFMVFEENF